MLTDAWRPVWGGGQVHIWELAKRLAARSDLSVDIVVPNLRDESDERHRRDEVPPKGVRVVRLGPPFRFPAIGHRCLFVARLAAFLCRHRYDVLHSHSYSTSLLLAQIGKLTSARTVFTVHGAGWRVVGGGLINHLPVERLGKRVLYRGAFDALLTVAECTLDETPKAALVKTIGNGVDVERFVPPAQARQRGETAHLLCVARLEPVKGLGHLLDAVARLIKSGTRCDLTIVGSGPEEANLREQTEALGIQSQVRFAGSMFGADLVRAYQSADLYVHASLSEGLPLAPLEAMATGLPIVLTSVGDCPKVIQQSQSGLLVPPGSQAKLVEGIGLLLKQDLQVIGQQGQEYVRATYSWDNVAEAVYAAYRSILDDRPD